MRNVLEGRVGSLDAVVFEMPLCPFDREWPCLTTLAAFRGAVPLAVRDAAAACAAEAFNQGAWREGAFRASDYELECGAEWVVIYRPGVRIRPRELQAFVNFSAMIARAALQKAPYQAFTAHG
jgi:hypothetical protein